MKKVLLSLGIIAVAGLTSFAQDANVGLKLGIGWSQWTGADIDHLKQYQDAEDMNNDLWDYAIGEKELENNVLYIGQLSDQLDLFNQGTDYEIGDKSEYLLIAGNDFTPRQSFHAGFQINSEINDYFWLKHEFVFATKGFAFTGTQYTDEITAKDSATDINGNHYWNYSTDQDEKEVELRYRSYHVDILPISLAGHYEGLQLFIGPYISVQLAQNWIDVTNTKVTTPGNDDFQYITDDAGQTTTSRTLSIIDYGYVMGFEYELPFGLNTGIRYMQGFGSVLETPEGEARTNAFNRDLRISLGYTFGKE